jgi:acetyl esterase/lipase
MLDSATLAAPATEAALPRACPLPGGLQVHHGVPYAALPGSRPLELDLYLPPAASGPVPLVVFVHGGGWALGSRRTVAPPYLDQYPSPFERIAAGGIAVASIDYRLSGEAIWPAPLHDAKAAVRWLRARAADLGIDPTNIAAWGESAGGHLAALLGLTGPELEGEVGTVGPSSAVSAVVSWYTPTNLGTIAEGIGADPMAYSREAQLVGARLPTVPERVAQASPVSHVRRGAPPFLLLHGRADAAVPFSQSEELRDALEGAGNQVELVGYDGAGHQWLGSPAAAADALDRTIAFLHAHPPSATEAHIAGARPGG